MPSRQSRPLVVTGEGDIDLFAAMAALSHPVRRAIVLSVASAPGSSCGSGDFGISKSALTHHWRVLREAGLIRQDPDGTRHRSWLRRDELDRRFPGFLDLVLAQPASTDVEQTGA